VAADGGGRVGPPKKTTAKNDVPRHLLLGIRCNCLYYASYHNGNVQIIFKKILAAVERISIVRFLLLLFP
jgi:hypothetical protein